MPTLPNPISLGLSAGLDVFQLGMHLLAAHDQRVRIAQEENHAVQQAVTTMDADLQTIFAAANAGDITATEAAIACLDVHIWYWQFILPFQQGPTKGPTMAFPNPRAPIDSAQGGIYYMPADGPDCHCSSQTACTAGCCIGCGGIDPTLSNAYVLFMRGKAFSFNVAIVVGNKYGLQTRNAYSLRYTPPKTIRQEELTINKQTGVISVGAPPSNRDAVIATGAVSLTAVPDQGGIASGPLTQPNMLTRFAGLNLSSGQKLGLGIGLAVVLVFALAGGRR